MFPVQEKGGKKWKIVVKAPLVIAACGSIHDPALLLRSGIKHNGQVGKHLHLHPATAVMGIFDKVGPKKGGAG
jgi:long-chain-alcohol oxidase